MTWQDDAVAMREAGPTWPAMANALSEKYGRPFSIEAVRSACRRRKEKIDLVEESAVLHLTDLHYGRKTDSFDIDVLDHRLDIMIGHALDINSILKAGYKFDRLYIPMTGDMIDGDEIYATHPHHLDQRAAFGLEQATKLAEMIKPKILRLKPVAPKIVIRGVPGNHGRVSRHTHEANNWDRAFYTMLRLMFLGNEDVEVSYAEKNIDIIQIRGHGFLLYHGGGIQAYHQIPFYGIRQRVLRWSKTLKTPFRVVLMGHFHQCLEDAIDDIEIKLSGAMPSDDDWSIEFLGVDAENKMRFFGVHADHPVTWEYKLDLKE